MTTPNTSTVCIRATPQSIAELFERDENPLRASSEFKEIPHIGDFLDAQCRRVVEGNTIQDLVAYLNGKSKTDMTKRLIECTLNARSNRCVNSTSQYYDKYHTADVNVCGFNALLQVLKYIHAHRDQYEQLGFSAIREMPDLANITRISPRTRGTNHGARHCSCTSTRRGCSSDECRWVSNRGGRGGKCIPRHGGGRDAGFEGVLMANNHRRTQRNGTQTRNMGGRHLTQGWMDPTQLQQPQQLRRGTRIRRRPTRYSPSIQGGFQEDHDESKEYDEHYKRFKRFKRFKRWKDAIQSSESVRESKSPEMRRFYNFTYYTF